MHLPSKNLCITFVAGMGHGGANTSQLLLRSTTKYFASGTIIADSKQEANGLMVITSGEVCQFISVKVASLARLLRFKIDIRGLYL